MGITAGRAIFLDIDFTDPSPRRKGNEYYFSTEFEYRTQLRQTILRWAELGTLETEEYEPLLSVAASTDSSRLLVESIFGQEVPETSTRPTVSRALRMYNFLPRVFELSLARSRSKDVTEAQDLIRSRQQEIRDAFNAAVRTLQSVEYLGAMRRPPERTYVNTGVAGTKIGADGGGWPSILALESSSRRRGSQLDITPWMKDAGIAASVSISWLTDRHYEIVVTNPSTGESENIADVGQGTSQVLPVIVAGLRLKSDDIFIVEEPEMHLHPKAQAALGDFFYDLVRRDVQCFVETHSEYLILRNSAEGCIWRPRS